MKNILKSAVLREDTINLANILINNKKKFDNSKFLITGAGGFLGNYLVATIYYLNNNVLDKPATLYCYDNFITGVNHEIKDDNIHFINHDVTIPFEIDDEIDYIIHAAGIASPLYYTKHPIETMDVSTIGTRNMLELAKQKNVKGFLFTSSSEVYGDPPDKYIPTPETYNGNVSISGPRACYDESKRFAEILCLNFWRVHGVPVKIVRYFNIYGPGHRQNDYRILPNFIERGLDKVPLKVHGDGENTRSYCYINDAIEATFKVLFSEENGEAYNIGNPSQEISINHLSEIVANLLPGKVPIEKIKPPHAVYGDSDPKRRCPDISKLQAAIDFAPKYNLEEGIGRTIKWYLGG